MTELTPGKKLRRLVRIGGVEYVLELSAAGVMLRRFGRRLPAAVLSLEQILTAGAGAVVTMLRRGAKRRRSSARAPKRRRKSSRRRR